MAFIGGGEVLSGTVDVDPDESGSRADPGSLREIS